MLRQNGSNSLVGRLVVYVHESNHRALRFWRRMGFEIVPDARHHGDHHILQMWVDNDS